MSRLRLAFAALAVLLLAAPQLFAVSTSVVISQFQVAGGTAADEFVELHNVGNTNFDLNGHRVVYRSAAGVTDVAIANWAASTIIPPGGYFLIAHSGGYDGAATLDTGFNLGATGSFAAAGGGFALRNGAVNTGVIIDSAGYGTATNAFVEGTVEPVPAANASAARLNSGCTDTDNNANDFAVVNPSTPRNSGTAVFLCVVAPPTPTLNINDVSQAETNAGTTTFSFSVSLTAPAGAGGVTFDIATADNTATTADSDYVAKSLTGQTIATGNTTYNFDVVVNGDTNIEASETFLVNVTSIVGATGGDAQGQGTIQNDDSPTLNVDDVMQVEGPGGTSTFAFTVSLTQPAGPGGVTFDITTANDTATTADSDYVANTLTGQTIPAGNTTYTFNVTVNGDNDVEPTETFFVNVSNVTGASAGDLQGLGTIATDEPQLSINNVTQAETNAGTTTFAFSVSLDIPAPPGGVTFDIATAPGTATAGTDYVHQALTAQSIAAGNTTYPFNVTVNGDALFEGNDTFFVDVTNVSAGTGVADGQGLGTISNDDTAPAFTIADVALTEGNAGTQTMTFTVALSGTREVSIDVNAATADSSATVADADYVANATTLTFAPGDATKTFDVTVNGDATAEGDEQFFVNLSGATAGAIISDTQALAVIRMDDPLGLALIDTPYSENFDALAQTTAATTPIAWTKLESLPNANLTYIAGTGSSTAGDTYSFGVAGTNPITDRAFGGLQSGSLLPTIGAFYRNDTGTTITNLAIQYFGEEWRLGTASRADRLDFQYSVDATSLNTGTWTDVDALDFSTPNQTSVGLKDGNAAANRAVRLGTVPGLSIAPGAMFWIRYSDFNASGADDGLAVDDFSIIANYSGAFLSIDDVTAFEGNAGTTTFAFTVTLSQPAPAGGVTFDITTQDNSATAGSDYVANTLTAQTITAGNTTYTFDVTVNGDTNTAPADGTETFFVNVTNLTNAVPSDSQGLGTIVDDDVTITLIHDIQGSGSTSPIVGSGVSIRGIVTGVKSNGFFVQEEDAQVDADPNTSEGIFVFTSTGPSPSVVLGAEVMVTATVAEFVPAADPQQPPVTELVTPTSVVAITTGNALPAPVVLSATFPDPAGPFDQLERVEHMRVSVASITVSGPSDGGINEANNTGTSNGRFHGVVTGVARPFREAGLQAPDLAPSGSIPPIPRWDFNPERLRIESATIGAPLLTVKSGDVVGPFVGPLDYAFRGYALYPDGTLTATIVPSTLPTTVTTPAANEVTVASFNIFHLYDTTDEPSTSDVVLTASAFDDRLNKASIAIRNNLKTPDVVGLQEVEHLTTLQALATRINSDAVTALQPDPNYVAYLYEGNDIGGIDVGFLVKTGEVSSGVPRVTVNSVTQIGAATTWIDPSDNAPHTLNDRPSIVLDAVVNRAGGLSFPLIVVNNHLRSLIGIESEEPNGLSTDGDRVRRKRLAQAEFLANYLQTRLTATPDEHIVLVGDFNAFDVNDGFVDVISTIIGTPPPDDQTVVPGDGVDLVNPDFVNLVNTPPVAERYSYLHEGNAQNIDHAIISAGLVTDTSARRIEHPRINADYPETYRADETSPLRLSDHDPVVAFFTVVSLTSSDFGVTLTHPTGYATTGTNTSYTINVANDGPDAGDVSTSVALPVGTTFQSFSAPAGWSCTTPPAGENGIFTCTFTAMPALSSANITLTVGIDDELAANTLLTRTATVDGASTDPVSSNDSESENVTVLQPSQYRGTKTVSGTFLPGGAVTYTITIFNDKPFVQTDNAGHELTDVLPSGVTLTGATATSGTAVPNAGTNTVTWNGAIASGGSVTITITATVDADASGTQSNQGSLADDFDGDGANERATVTDDPSLGGTSDPTNFTVTSTAGLVSATKNVSGTFVAGTNVTYTIVLTNGMALEQADNPGNELTDVLPATLSFVSVNATSGTPAHSAGTISWNGALALGASTTITIVAQIDPAATGTISNQAAFAYDSEARGSNDLNGVSDNPATAAANDATTFNVIAPGAFSATKRVSAGSFIPGGSVTYTIVLTNGLGHTLDDNAGNEFVDVLPPELQLVSATSTSGAALATTATNTVTWNGSIPASGSVTITIEAAIPAHATAGNVTNQGTANVDFDDDGTNETPVSTDDPDVAGTQATTFIVSTPAQVSVTKTSSGTFTPGSTVTYTIVITNNLAHALGDNAGDEFTDVLPAQLQLLTATATSGTASGNVGTNTVTWNGAIAPGTSVTITIEASIPANATAGNVSNQGQARVDLDGDGTSDTTVNSDNPNVAGSQATTFRIVAASDVTATKSVSTSGMPGQTVTYTIVVTNNLPHTLDDNTGDELVDILPAQVEIEGATATTGTATFDEPSNTVRWNGSLASGASVTITITARIRDDATGNVANQATYNADLDDDGTSETPIPTNSSAFAVAAAVAAIPTLSTWMLLAFAAMLAAVALYKSA